MQICRSHTEQSFTKNETHNKHNNSDVGRTSVFPKIKMIQKLNLADNDYGFEPSKKLVKYKRNLSTD